MTVYIEYAFLENFLLDGVLLWLAAKGARASFRWRWLLLSAAVGGVFAVLYPLIRLPSWLGFILKVAVGLLLPLLALGRVKGKRAWRSYALCATFFFLLTVAFGGALLGGMQSFSRSRLPSYAVLVSFLLLACAAVVLIEKLYKRRSVYKRVYACALWYGERKIQADGFFDSGNLATKGGIPVCFLSAELFYELVGDIFLFGGKEWGQVCDEICITTMAGERKVPVFKGILEVRTEKTVKKEVYFAAATNMVSREYKILLNGNILEEEECGA